MLKKLELWNKEGAHRDVLVRWICGVPSKQIDQDETKVQVRKILELKLDPHVRPTFKLQKVLHLKSSWCSLRGGLSNNVRVEEPEVGSGGLSLIKLSPRVPRCNKRCSITHYEYTWVPTLSDQSWSPRVDPGQHVVFPCKLLQTFT